MKRFAAIMFVLLTAMFVTISCKKNSFKLRESTYPEGKALVKIGHFIAFNANSPTRVVINDIVLSNELLYPISFPGGGLNMNGSLNSDYLMISPGAAKVQLFVVNQGTPKTLYDLIDTTINFEANKRYTLFMADTTNAVAFAVPDETSTPDSGFSKVKFVNAMPNMPALDFYKGANAATAPKVASNVAYKTASDYVEVTPGNDSFFIRPAGADIATAPIVRRPFALANQRIYTVLARGYNGTTGNRIPHLSAIVNQ